MATPVVFKYGTRAQYDALQTKATNALYFLEDTGEIYRGTVPLARGNHYEGIFTAEDVNDNGVIARVLGATPALKDDIFVVKHLIAGDKYSYTSYIYTGTNWAAMDGNYNAENVYFDENITITTAVGNISIDSSTGSGSIPASGKNLKQVFESIWTKENYKPTVTNPAITLSVSSNVKGEVGTSFNAPKATAKISEFGKFEFGSQDSSGSVYAATAQSDVVFSTLKVGAADTAATLTDAKSASIADVSATSTTKEVSYTGESGVFTDAVQTQKFSASATHGGSARKGVSNLGNLVNTAGTGTAASFDVAGKGIAANAGTMVKNGSSFTATGYRAWFMGELDYVPEASAIDSAFVRDLTNKGEVTTTTFTLTPGANGSKCVLIALPAAGTLTEAILTSSMNTDILEDYTKNQKTVQVADASEKEGTEVAYTVYWYKPASLGSDEVHKLTVTKK